MAEPILITMGAVLLAFALLTLRRAVRVARLIRILPLLPIEPVASLAPGLRLAAGTLESPTPMKSPFHQRDCVYYAYRVEEPGPTPRRLATGKNWTETLLRDATGTIPIETRAAYMRAQHEHTTNLDRLDGLPEHQRQFLHDAGIEAKHLPRFGALHIVEYTVEPGDAVHVLGVVQTQADRKAFYRARHSPLAVSATRDAGLIPGLRNELLLFSVSTVLLTAFALLFLVASLA